MQNINQSSYSYIGVNQVDSMGVQQSAELREMLNHSTIDQMLNDEMLVSSLMAAVPYLSPRSRDNLRRLSAINTPSQAQTGPLSGPKLRPLLNLEEADVIVQSPLQDWLLRGQWSLPAALGLDHLHFRGEDDVSVALLERYTNTLGLEKRRVVDRIRWRFFAMFFYDLHVLVNGQDYLTSRGLDTIIQAIKTADLTHADLVQMRKNLRSWIARGHRYRNLSNNLGGSGCLFLLPEKISDYLWEDSLPLKGPAFDEGIAKLKEIGLGRMIEKYSAHEMGASIESLLLPFRWHVTNHAARMLPLNEHAKEEIQRSRRRRSHDSKKQRYSRDNSSPRSTQQDTGESPRSAYSTGPSHRLSAMEGHPYQDNQGQGSVLDHSESTSPESGSGGGWWGPDPEFPVHQQPYLPVQDDNSGVNVMNPGFMESAEMVNQGNIISNPSNLSSAPMLHFDYGQTVASSDHTMHGSSDQATMSIQPPSNYAWWS